MKYLIAALLSVALLHFSGATPALKTEQVLKTPRAVKPVKAKVAAPKEAPKVPAHQPETKAVEAAKPKPQVTTYPVSCAAYEPIVARYNWNVRMAMAIMQAESGCNPYAVSPASLNYDGCSDFGLLQLHCERVFNPSQNIAIAYQKYQNQGWNAWSTYNNGAVWRYY